MTSRDLVLSVPADVVNLYDVRQRRQTRPGHQDVLVSVPNFALLYAVRRSEDTGESVKAILSLLISAGIEASLRPDPAKTDLCKNGRPHKRGTINVRHCGGCGIPM